MKAYKNGNNYSQFYTGNFDRSVTICSKFIFTKAVVGSKDTTGQLKYDAAASDKERLVVPGANHGESYKVAKEVYEEKL
ncbi:hypothetical protein [Anaerocolumna xylanovorans]|uniref:Uncharacterized protein n=1 Tax=Anaerocolumna xylanovorans DSM 12503 TaxID=1121345 RepID=A0A1M7Y3M3_9FIRM|nr:hypothetical protein [Anaerocolumna xylanovorans]SHO46759.1 hypothetical protein SAMN02745217_01278 [Anaerocolumna xylanovorans DSM 12503]